MSSGEGSNGAAEEPKTGEQMSHTGMSETAAQPQEAGGAAPMGPQTEGRRTQLKVVRENIEILSRDIGNFRRSHQVSTKRLEGQMATLQKDLNNDTQLKEVANGVKSHQASNKRLEKQVSTLRNELAALKSSIAKDAARGRAKQEATLSRILAKVSAKTKAPAKPKPAKSSKKK